MKENKSKSIGNSTDNSSSTGTWNGEYDDIVLDNMVLDDILPSDSENDVNSDKIQQTATESDNQHGGLGNTSTAGFTKSTQHSVEDNILLKNVIFYRDKTIDILGYKTPYLIRACHNTEGIDTEGNERKNGLTNWYTGTPMWSELENPAHFSDILNQDKMAARIEDAQRDFAARMYKEHGFKDDYDRQIGLDSILALVDHCDILGDQIDDVKAILTDINAFFMQAGLVNDQRILYSAACMCFEIVLDESTLYRGTDVIDAKNTILMAILDNIDYVYISDGFLKLFDPATSSPEVFRKIERKKFEATEEEKYDQILFDEKMCTIHRNEEFKEKYGRELSLPIVKKDTFDFYKDKINLRNDYMMIVAKYFETPKDYINVTRVNKEYQNLIEMFRYNPIDEDTLFPSAQTIHLYDIDDQYKVRNRPPGGYVVWFNTQGNGAKAMKARLGEKIDFKKDVTSEGCTELTANKDDDIILTFTDDVNTVVLRAFEHNTDINIVIFSESIAKLGKNAFANASNLSEIEFSRPNRIRVISDSCFYKTGIQRIVIPEGVTSIEDSAFQSCSHLVSVTLPRGLISIGTLSFHDTAIATIDIPSSVRKIKARAFTRCMLLTKVTFADEYDYGEVTVDDFAFTNCVALQTITINMRNIVISDRALACISGGQHVVVDVYAHRDNSGTVYCKAVMNVSGININLAGTAAQAILNNGDYTDKAVVTVNVHMFDCYKLDVDDPNEDHYFKEN